MELLVVLFIFVLIVALIIAFFGAIAGGILAAGYYITLPALALITAIIAAYFYVWYRRTPEWNGRRENLWIIDRRRDIKERALWVGTTLTVIWVIAILANWNGTPEFFQSISNFFIRSGS